MHCLQTQYMWWWAGKKIALIPIKLQYVSIPLLIYLVLEISAYGILLRDMWVLRESDNADNAYGILVDKIFYTYLKRNINMIFFISASSLTWHIVLAVLHSTQVSNTLILQADLPSLLCYGYGPG